MQVQITQRFYHNQRRLTLWLMMFVLLATTLHPHLTTVALAQQGNGTVGAAVALAGSLSGTLSDGARANNTNLTTEGTEDWGIWGTGSNTSLAPVVRKQGGSAIANLINLSNGNSLRGLGQFGSVAHSFQWQNGTPTTFASNVRGGL